MGTDNHHQGLYWVNVCVPFNSSNDVCNTENQSKCRLWTPNWTPSHSVNFFREESFVETQHMSWQRENEKNFFLSNGEILFYFFAFFDNGDGGIFFDDDKQFEPNNWNWAELAVQKSGLFVNSSSSSSSTWSWKRRRRAIRIFYRLLLAQECTKQLRSFSFFLGSFLYLLHKEL